jgi:DNA polymerase-3 subunit delta
VNADYQKILSSLKAQKFAPVYLIDGDEPFYLDRVVEAFEEILPPHERDFNLITLYGGEAQWADVVNACRRFPMFAERQVVILREAAQMKTLQELAAYVENPAPTTVLLIEHRFKKVDGRGKLVKAAKSKGVYYSSEKVKDERLPDWIADYGQSIGMRVGYKEAGLLATYLGADLQKVANELGKLRLNVPDGAELTADLIRKNIGISAEHNLFQFPETLTNPGAAEKRYRMLAYFAASPKLGPMPLVTTVFYTYFSQLYRAHFAGGDGKEAATAAGVPPFRLREARQTASRIGITRIEECLLLIAEYGAKGVGVGSEAKDGELLREMVGRMEAVLA